MSPGLIIFVAGLMAVGCVVGGWTGLAGVSIGVMLALRFIEDDPPGVD